MTSATELPATHADHPKADSTIHAIELVRLSNAANIRERLQRVGFRMLSLSLADTALTLIVLWPLAGA